MVNKDKLLFSIITPSLNQGQFIEENILSIKNQDYQNIEHLIIDGGSADETLNILKKYEGTYNMCWISEKDSGQSNAINKGFKMAKGNILSWLNCDDFYLAGTLSMVADLFEKDPSLDFVYGDVEQIYENKRFVRKIGYQTLESLLNKGCLISQPATFFSKNIIQKIGLLNENLYLAMDYDFFIRIFKSKNSRILYLPKTLTAVKVHPQAKTIKYRLQSSREAATLSLRYGGKRFSRLHFINLIKIILNKIGLLSKIRPMFLL